MANAVIESVMILKRNCLILALLILIGQNIFALDQVKIASFNLRIFGQSKVEKAPVVKAIAEIIKRFDIVALQEIRDKEESAILVLMDEINKDSKQYDLIVGPRLGRTSSKEQYAFVYRADKFNYDYFPITWNDDDEDAFEREPYIANFYTTEGNFDFILINIHTKPEDAEKEIGKLPQVMAFAAEYYGEEDVICLGDFNADGSYFKEDEYLNIFPENEYLWIIPNEADTNVAQSEMTYDRIAATTSATEDYLGEWGVMRFNELESINVLNLKELDISDHYPIWALFATGNDTDWKVEEGLHNEPSCRTF